MSGMFLSCALWYAMDASKATADLRAFNVASSEDNRLFDRSSLLAQGSQSLSKISTQITPSVVHIQSERDVQGSGRVEETGSGVIMTSKTTQGTYVVTNRHVIQGAKMNDIHLQLFDGRVIHPLAVMTDEKTDIAVLRIRSNKVRPAAWGDSTEVQIGHMVLAMGSPFGLSQSVTFGIISAKGRRSLKLGTGTHVINQDFLQTDAAINPGNSGGPLIGLNGRVIGINTAIASNSGGNEGIGFSIPSNLVKHVFEQLVAHGHVRRAYLGVKLDPAFSQDDARRLHLDRVRGARVLEVYRNTPASGARLTKDDVILLFNKTEVQDENHLINLVSLTPINTVVQMTILRSGRQMRVNVNLANRSELERRTTDSNN